MEKFFLYVIATAICILTLTTILSDYHTTHYLLLICQQSGAKGC